MKFAPFVGACSIATLLVACGGSDIEIAPSTVDNSQDNSVTETGGQASTSNFCASYEKGGQTLQGTQQGIHCIYGTDFVSLRNPLTVDVTFPDIGGAGAHVFLDSLVVGQNFDTQAGLTEAGLTQGGDGAKITLEPGVTLAFQSSDDYFVINRGSQIIAEGTSADPITVTSASDAVDGTVGITDVQEWGGMIINGFGVTNKCDYTGTRGAEGFALANPTDGCHVEAEGKSGAGQTHYGGINDADNSGSLQYFIVKHTGAQVAVGNELNGISFNAVGSETKVDFLQTHSTFDDGIEFFGGAVNVDHFVATFVRDDSIDIDEGYIGTITNALVIQSDNDGNHCIESDGIGSYSKRDEATRADFMARNLNSDATISNLTCALSGNSKEEGTHDPGAGWRIREGHTPTISNAIVYMADTDRQEDDNGNDADGNYCLRIESSEGLAAAVSGDLSIRSSLFVCQDLTKGDDVTAGQTQLAYLQQDTLNNITVEIPQSNTQELAALDGFYSEDADADTEGFQVEVNGSNQTITPVESSFIGAVVDGDDDWVTSWAIGLDASESVLND